MSHSRKLTGNRFEGFYSINRRYADIVDRKRRGILISLRWDDVDQLRDRLEAVLHAHSEHPETMKPHDIADPRTHKKLVGLNYEDTQELYELAGGLREILIPFQEDRSV